VIKKFTGISSIIYNDKLISLITSSGYVVTNTKGLAFDEVIDFFYDLRVKKESNEIFVCYAFQRDNEFIFSSLPDDVKDRLFQSFKVRQKVTELEDEIEEQESRYFNSLRDTVEFSQLEFDKYVNEVALKDLIEVRHNGYDIKLINGKLLTIAKKRKRFILYDVYGFFQQSLFNAIQTWLQKNVQYLADVSILTKLAQIREYAKYECKYVSEITDVLYRSLLSYDISLTRFHGVTAVSTWLLSKTKARKEFHSYKKRNQLSGELYKAMMQSYYGGRTEQFKIGTFDAGVNVYDINSAYGHAITQLPKFLSKPILSNNYQGQQFSVWFVEYDFTTGNDLCYGLLPNRNVRQTSYLLRGCGYFWQPEISYILEHYPDCISIKHGFYIPYTAAEFTNGVIELYELRKELQRHGHPLEKVIKLALSAIYGKFCESQGKQYYYNMFYAGYITSETRTKLLRATKGYEKDIICFLTDAVHTATDLPVSQSDELGEWKRTTYTKAIYLDNGVYRLYSGHNIAKEKTKGFRSFNFDLALLELQEKRTYTALAEFFIGHNLHSFMPIRFNEYLKMQSESKKTNPFELTARVFDTLDIDLTKNYCDSRMIMLGGGKESSLYNAKIFRESDLSKDSLMAGRV
jgi:hypothetical protein